MEQNLSNNEDTKEVNMTLVKEDFKVDSRITLRLDDDEIKILEKIYNNLIDKRRTFQKVFGPVGNEQGNMRLRKPPAHILKQSRRQDQIPYPVQPD